MSDIAYRTLSKRKFEEKKLYASDILIERSGGSETQPVGRVGFITDEMAKTDYAFANFIQRISLNDEVNAKFVYYCLQQMYEMGITAGMQSQTTGIRNLDWKQYIKVAIPKPSPDEQTAIAAILSKVDESIAAVQRSIAAAERLKKSLMQNLLTGRMKPDGTLRKEDEFYVDEKFGRVPLGWEVKKVTEVADYVQYGLNQASSEKGKIPMLRMNNIVKGKMTNAPLVYVELNDSLLQQYKLEKGDILFNRTNSLDLVGIDSGAAVLYLLEGKLRLCCCLTCRCQIGCRSTQAGTGCQCVGIDRAARNGASAYHGSTAAANHSRTAATDNDGAFRHLSSFGQRCAACHHDGLPASRCAFAFGTGYFLVSLFKT